MGMYEIIVEHKGLGKYRVVRGRDLTEVQYRATELENKWNSEYSRLLEKQKNEELKLYKSQESQKLTRYCQKIFSRIENYLQYVLTQKYNISKKEGDFLPYVQEKPQCSLLEFPKEFKGISFSEYPSWAQFVEVLCVILGIPLIFMSVIFLLTPFVVFMPKVFSPVVCFVLSIANLYLGFYLSKKFSDKILKKYFLKNFEAEKKEEWQNKYNEIKLKNEKIMQEYEKITAKWEKEKETFLAKQQSDRDAFNGLIDSYEKGELEGVVFHVGELLKKLPTLDVDEEKKETSIPLLNEIVISEEKPEEVSVGLEYNDESKVLILDWPLQPFEVFRKLPKEIKFSKDEPEKIFYSDREIKKRYDSFIYQMIFSVLYVVFTGDTKKHINGIVINGYVSGIDRTIGKPCTNYIASLQISREDFEQLNLAEIDPKQCFKKLKGLAAVSLHEQTPIPPILKINKEDNRFVEAYDVSQNIDAGTNLASMDWQDFENLIRELFERYFSKNGGECKVTQASRDGGVDAIAFDPDPIRGGKIIIQAKRYTNVVGVSAVRDLYGTILNEGANKGILVTTSDFGTDAHKFANGKPITLINGSNLLHLLQEEMGKKAYISLSEAKKVLKNQ